MGIQLTLVFPSALKIVLLCSLRTYDTDLDTREIGADFEGTKE